jgi:predicted transcriptional regulator
MSEVRIGISSGRDIAEAIERVTERSAAGEKIVAEPTISFPSYELMHKVLAPSRLAIIKAMSGKGPLTIRQVAALVGRDLKAVHRDVTTLTHAGVIDRTEKGVVFPYDRIRFAFSVDAAA